MVTDVQKVLEICILSWRQAKGRTKSVPRSSLQTICSGEVVAMDFFGPPRKTKAGNIFVLVLPNLFSESAKPRALKKRQVADIVLALRDFWMPRREASAKLLSDDGPLFTASIVRTFCEGVRARMNWSTPYPPQGNTMVESYIYPLRKSSAALVGEDG